VTGSSTPADLLGLGCVVIAVSIGCGDTCGLAPDGDRAATGPRVRPGQAPGGLRVVGEEKGSIGRSCLPLLGTANRALSPPLLKIY